MYFVDFTAGNKEYKLRLNVRSTIALERQLGCNPLNIFGDGDTIPSMTTMVQVLHASLQQMQHGITLNDTYDIFEDWLNDGNTVAEFLTVIVDIFRASGIIKSEAEKN